MDIQVATRSELAIEVAEGVKSTTNDQTTADGEIVSPESTKSARATKTAQFHLDQAILKASSTYFQAMFSPRWKNPDGKAIRPQGWHSQKHALPYVLRAHLSG
ncbi:hypothetical protein N7467_004744 [Penicillium canescens]|nr:hypothetical protein N7467_004744 [Penicillium canescens]